MNMNAISVDSLSKLYRLNRIFTGGQTFRDLITSAALSPLRRIRQLRGSEATMEDFWALKDVSFQVKPGEVVGIIGRNGAGKSTLLKVLSRIVEPTMGEIRLRGKVASLLEVGTGFHPELTGRENIFLNGSILGMKRREIVARFDEIVAFAEVDKFIDTPVKRYSSGMYVRLAFAVAAHLDPEILIVDEVLAVGDAEFQKKCLGKMKEVSAGGGRTVLFVSHNMAAVRSLCSRAILLRNGQVIEDGPSEAAVNTYLAAAIESTLALVEFTKPLQAGIWMSRASLLFDGQVSAVGQMGMAMRVMVEFASSEPTRHPRIGYVLKTLEGESLLNANNRFQPSAEYELPVRRGELIIDLGCPPLLPGRYTISLWLGDTAEDHHIVLEALNFEVTERDLWGNGQIPPPTSPMWWPTQFKFLPATD